MHHDHGGVTQRDGTLYEKEFLVARHDTTCIDRTTRVDTCRYGFLLTSHCTNQLSNVHPEPSQPHLCLECIKKNATGKDTLVLQCLGYTGGCFPFPTSMARIRRRHDYFGIVFAN